MANLLRGGFRPKVRGRGPRRYEVASSYGTALFPGDVVTLVTGGTVEASTAGDAALILGVVAALSYVASGERVYGRHVPATTVYSPTARGSKNATYAWVWDDPATEFVASVTSHADTDTAAEVYASVGACMDLVATAGSTVYHRSGYTLDGNEVAATAQFRIVEIYREAANDLSAANWKAVCMVNEGFHVFHSAAGI
jgi:hypothetical protein